MEVFQAQMCMLFLLNVEECCGPLVQYEVMDDARGAAPTEDLKPPLIWLVLNILPEFDSSGALVGHHHFINTLPVGGGNEKALFSEHVKKRADLMEAVSAALHLEVVTEVDISS